MKMLFKNFPSFEYLRKEPEFLFVDNKKIQI